MKGNEKYSDKLAELLYSGSILKAYGKKTLLNIQPELEIGLVRFSIVALETGGKDHLDIYLPIETVRQFVTDIDSGLAARKIAADTKSDYPEAYKWVTGENGSKSLTIGRGKSGIVANIKISGNTQDGTQTQYKMAVLQGSDLRQLSFLFKLITGLFPVVQGTYYAKLLKVYYTGVAERKELHRAGMSAEANDSTPESYREPVEYRRNNTARSPYYGDYRMAN